MLGGGNAPCVTHGFCGSLLSIRARPRPPGPSSVESSSFDRGLKTVTRGTLIMFISSLAFIIEAFVWRVVLVRTLSPVDWSVFALGLTYAGLFSTLGRLGLINTLARNIAHARTDNERRGIIRVALVFGGGAAVGSGVLLFFFAGFLGAHLGLPDLTVALQLFAISVSFSVFATLLASIFQGFEDVRPNAYFVQILNPALFLVFLGIVYGVASLHLSIDTVLVAYVLASASTLLATVAYTLRQLPGLLPSGPRQDMLLSTMGLALPLFVVAASTYLSGSVDTLVLGVYDSLAVGTYVASLSMARLLTVGITALAFIYLPVASRHHRDGDIASIEMLYVTATKWILLASLPFFLVFMFLPSLSLRFVYSSSYSTIVIPLQILVTGAFVSTLMGPATAAQVAFEEKWLLVANAAVAAVADTILAVWLVPSLGMDGAALAWASATALYPALSLIEIALLHRIHPFHRHVWVPLAATVAPLGFVFYLAPHALALWVLPLVGVGCLLWFIGMVIATRSVDEGDRRLLQVVEGLLGVQLNFLRRIGAWATASREEGPSHKNG